MPLKHHHLRPCCPYLCANNKRNFNKNKQKKHRYGCCTHREDKKHESSPVKSMIKELPKSVRTLSGPVHQKKNGKSRNDKPKINPLTPTSAEPQLGQTCNQGECHVPCDIVRRTCLGLSRAHCDQVPCGADATYTHTHNRIEAFRIKGGHMCCQCSASHSPALPRITSKTW